MRVYVIYLSLMCVLFGLSSGVLFFVALGPALRLRLQRAAVYLGLTVLSCVVAVGFLFLRRLQCLGPADEGPPKPEKEAAKNLIGIPIPRPRSHTRAVPDRSP